MIVTIKNFLVLLHLLIYPTLEKRLERAFAKDNVAAFVRLIHMNGGAGIDEKVVQLLHDGIEQSKL